MIIQIAMGTLLGMLLFSLVSFIARIILAVQNARKEGMND